MEGRNERGAAGFSMVSRYGVWFSKPGLTTQNRRGYWQRAGSPSTNSGRKPADPIRRTRNRNLMGREMTTQVQHELYRTENRQCAERRQVEVTSLDVPLRIEGVKVEHKADRQ